MIHSRYGDCMKREGERRVLCCASMISGYQDLPRLPVQRCYARSDLPTSIFINVSIFEPQNNALFILC
jgi:hypothetical protein